MTQNEFYLRKLLQLAGFSLPEEIEETDYLYNARAILNKQVAASWAANPDRMGGSFSSDEINDGWR